MLWEISPVAAEVPEPMLKQNIWRQAAGPVSAPYDFHFHNSMSRMIMMGRETSERESL
jgi:hypothetical protein